MKRFSGIMLLLLLCLATTFLGCADLKTIDFSGEIALTPRDASDGEGFIELGERNYSTRWKLDHDLYFRPSTLGDFLDALIHERAYSSRFGIEIGKEAWICGSPVLITTMVNSNGKIRLEAEGKSEGIKNLQNLTWNESGDPFWKSFDYGDKQWDSASLYHEGTLINGFTDYQSNKEFLIKAEYRFDVKCKKVLFDNNGQTEIDAAQSYLDLNLHVSTGVGYSQYLCGEKTFADQKGRKANLTMIMTDSDLDGRFTEKDSIKCSISNSFYMERTIPFGTPIKLDSRSNMTYRMNLIEKPDGTYALLIKPC